MAKREKNLDEEIFEEEPLENDDEAISRFDDAFLGTGRKICFLKLKKLAQVFYRRLNPIYPGIVSSIEDVFIHPESEELLIEILEEFGHHREAEYFLNHYAQEELRLTHHF